mgnify:CR=1 FL=1|jgi:hypothetical protein
MRSILAQLHEIKKISSLFDIDKHQVDRQTDFRNNSATETYNPVDMQDTVQETKDTRKFEVHKNFNVPVEDDMPRNLEEELEKAYQLELERL